MRAIAKGSLIALAKVKCLRHKMNIIAPDNAAEAAAAKLRDPSLNCGLSDTVVVKLNRSGVRYKEGEQAILEVAIIIF